MPVVVMLGAGASCFGGATIFRAFDGTKTQQSPPLGPQLFTRLRAEGGVAATFRSELAEVFSGSFEQGMRCIDNWSALIGFQRQVAAHLARYELMPGNCYQRLVRALGPRCPHVLWVSLNYDFLLEQAIWMEGLRVTHDVVHQGGTDVQVLKPHGSVTFLPDIGNMVLQGNEACGFAGGPAPFMFNPPIRFECNADYDSVIQRLKAWYGNESFREMAPVIAQYAYGKRFTSNTNWAEQANRLLAHRLAAASDVYLIGVRLTLDDTHIWEPLRRSQAKIWVINPTFDDYECWAKGRTSAIQQLAERFDETDKIHASIEAQLN